MNTNKDLLTKGIKYMGIALILMFIGPTLLYIVVGDQESTMYIPLLIISLLICIASIVIAFKGINTIMNSMFNKKD